MDGFKQAGLLARQFAKLPRDELDHVDGILAAGFQPHVASSAVAAHLVGWDGGSMLLHPLLDEVGVCRREYAPLPRVLYVSPGSEAGILFGDRLQEGLSAKTRSLACIGQLDNLYAHLAHEAANGILRIGPVVSAAAILDAHRLSLIGWKRKIGVVVDEYPNVLQGTVIGIFVYHRHAVVADANRSFIGGQ